MEGTATFNPEIIRAKNLVKIYATGVTGLNGLNLSISRGEMVGILGASGSGKTTFFRLLNGSITPTRGELFVLGKRLGRLPYKSLQKLRSRMALVYQNHNIIPGLTVAQNVLMGRLGKVSLLRAVRMALLQTNKELEDIHHVLDQLGLADKMFHLATDLSGGQQQRVAIARALFSDAEIILADEPIASVDYKTAETVLTLLKNLNRDKQTTIIMNLHQQDFALNFCPRVVVLDKGNLVYDGPPENWICGGRKNIVSGK
ncbi:ABC transporter related protein [Thermincola potens JR]|uniref:ABC transporter related protein n=2 Tax=Thermincola TaxID=278993 RepID=D5XBJ4_THEPJ|nr:ABC transporter related protein [Thermincola potens JR]